MGFSRQRPYLQTGDSRLPKLLHERGKYYTRDEQAPRICGMAVYARSMSITLKSGVEKLRWAWDTGLQAMARFFCRFLGGYGFVVRTGLDYREGKQQRQLLQRKLPVGDVARTGKQQTNQPISQYTESFTPEPHPPVHAILPTSPRSASTLVYDIVNCGPRNRFTVRDQDGYPRLVHNCENIVQAISRDVLGEAIRTMESEDIPVALHVHDETVSVIPVAESEAALKRAIEIFSRVPDWATGWPLGADGKIVERYGK